MAVLLIDPVVAMLHNCKQGTWHPILFEEAPVPGANGPARHRSKAHHTAGFSQRDAAVTAAKELANQLEDARVFLDSDIQWDGRETPALVQFFPPAEQVA